jgi:DNA-binding NarL/FixJ family response regulator
MRAMLREALDADPGLRVIGEAGDGNGAVRLASALQPDVVLLDIGMPGPATAEVVSGVRRAAPSAAIVVLSGYGPERLDPAITGEVAAHLPKTTDLDTVRRTLRAAGKG